MSSVKGRTYTSTGVGGALVLGRFCRQHGDLGAGLLDELLQVDLPQLLGQLLQLVLHVLWWSTDTKRMHVSVLIHNQTGTDYMLGHFKRCVRLRVHQPAEFQSLNDFHSFSR